MESFNKNTNSQLPSLPPLPPSHLGWQSSSANSPIIPLAPPSYDISGNAADKAKGLALAPETTQPNSEIQVVDLEDEDLEEMDAKQQKKVLASREYSLRYRVKQAAYVTKLENEVKVLQTEIAVNTPRVKYAGHRNKLLRAENHAMRQKLSAYTDELKFKQAQHEALVKERDSLRQLHQALLQQGAAEAFNPPPDYQMVNLGLDQPGFGLGLADQFTGPAGLVDTLMLNQPAEDLNQYGWPGQSFVEMNDLDMPNMGTFIDPFEMNHLGMDMDDHMAMNPLNMINNNGDDDADLQDPAGPSFRFM